MKPPLIEFEILWLEEPDDFRPGTPGHILNIRVSDVTIIRRRDLSAACLYAANRLRSRHETGFSVRKKRDV